MKRGRKLEEKEGILAEIIYQNEVNSYTVGIFETEEEQFTVVGYLPFICKGDSLKIIGKFIEHKDYGEQFKIETFEKLMPQTLSALEKYLANGNIKGVGPATASKIIKLFGEETIHVLKYEPSKLAQIKGITKDKAKEISESFIENWEVWQIVGFLERFGLGAESAKKVYDLLGINAISEIENDPYILIDIARGVEFSQIDKMAIELGIERENQKRVKSGIKYALIKITYNGHCCTLKENLIEYVKQLLGVAEEIIEEGLINLKANEDIVIEKRDEEPANRCSYRRSEIGGGQEQAVGKVWSLMCGIHDHVLHAIACNTCQNPQHKDNSRRRTRHVTQYEQQRIRRQQNKGDGGRAPCGIHREQPSRQNITDDVCQSINQQDNADHKSEAKRS